MKVVFITTIPESLRFLRGHIRYLRRQGAVVQAISSPAPALARYAEEFTIECSGLEMTRRISPLRDLLALWQLIHCLRRFQPDIVHAHTPKAGILGMSAAFIAGVPIRIYHIHGLPLLTARGIKRSILWWCDWVACRLAHEVLCVSPSIQQVVRSEGICGQAKLAVLANGTIDGVDAEDQFNPSRFDRSGREALRRTLNIPVPARVAGFVGRIVPDKGINELLEAFGRLSQEFANLHLLLVGSFENHQPLPPAAMAALHDNPRIHVVDFVADPAPYYSIMDVLVFPTHREGFGLVAAEAAAMEVPVVTTNIPGCVDSVCDGVTGTLVPVGNAEALAAAVADYLRDPESGRLRGIAGRQRVLREFSPALVHHALWQHYLWWSDRFVTRPLSERRSLAA